MLHRVGHGRRCHLSWLVVGVLVCLSHAALAQLPQDQPAMRPAAMPLTAPGLNPPGGAPPGAPAASGMPQVGPGQLVVDVIIEGEHTSKDYEIQKHIHTRKDREFDADVLQGDVRRLVTSGLFRDVKTYTEQAAGGVIVRFKVFERPRIGEIKFLGNHGFSDRKLTKEIGVKEGDPLNSYAAEESRRKIEELYHTGGFPKATVSIFEGDKPGDRGLVFLINEGYLERISAVTFEGNTISPDGVLKTKIQSKPGWFWYLFGGKVDRTKIDADVQTITAYYRALGFFRARVSRSLDYDETGKWLQLKFIIDEGPRYKVRNVAIEGSSKFSSEPLAKFMDLKSGEYFNQGESNKDLTTLTDLYGSQGHVFADVQADLRFLEEPGMLDVAYRIKEGDVFKIGAINVHVGGEFPHTKTTVVLNRVSQRPGDIIDIREIRNSERRLMASQLFAGAPGQNDGDPPRIVVRPPDLNSLSDIAAAAPPQQQTGVAGGERSSTPAGRGLASLDPSHPAAPQQTVRGQEPEAPRAMHPLPTIPAPPPPCIYSWEGRQPAMHRAAYPPPPPTTSLR